MAGQMNYIDAHCHLSDERIGNDLDAQLAECEARGIRRFVLAGYSPEDWSRQRHLVSKLGNRVVPCFGLHPWWVAGHSSSEMKAALSQLEKDLPAARLLGETGLDYAGGRGEAAKAELQAEAFLAQLEMSRKMEKPLVLHIVRAHENALSILRRLLPANGWKGWIHSYSGSADQVSQYINLGFCISLGGSTTRMNEAKIKSLLAAIPENRLLLETDAPDQIPRLPELSGQTLNRPVNLLAIASFLAGHCGRTPEALLDKSREIVEKVIA